MWGEQPTLRQRVSDRPRVTKHKTVPPRTPPCLPSLSSPRLAQLGSSWLWPRHSEDKVTATWAVACSSAATQLRACSQQHGHTPGSRVTHRPAFPHPSSGRLWSLGDRDALCVEARALSHRQPSEGVGELSTLGSAPQRDGSRYSSLGGRERMDMRRSSF